VTSRDSPETSDRNSGNSGDSILISLSQGGFRARSAWFSVSLKASISNASCRSRNQNLPIFETGGSTVSKPAQDVNPIAAYFLFPAIRPLEDVAIRLSDFVGKLAPWEHGASQRQIGVRHGLQMVRELLAKTAEDAYIISEEHPRR
jgi:hypothetical protein